jgi:hypothetical protein
MTARNRTRTAATPNRPAAPAEPAKASRTRTTKPVIDFSKLAAADAELPKGTRSSVLDGTPFVEWMTDSRKRGVAKAVTVPESAEKQTVYLIRQAAGRLDCGVKVVADQPSGGKVTITFQAKDKRAANGSKS